MIRTLILTMIPAIGIGAMATQTDSNRLWSYTESLQAIEQLGGLKRDSDYLQAHEIWEALYYLSLLGSHEEKRLLVAKQMLKPHRDLHLWERDQGLEDLWPHLQDLDNILISFVPAKDDEELLKLRTLHTELIREITMNRVKLSKTKHASEPR